MSTARIKTRRAKPVAKKPAPPLPTPNLKDPDVARRHCNLSIDAFLPIATKAGYEVEIVYMGSGVYHMRRRGPKEVTVLVNEQNVVKEIRG